MSRSILDRLFLVPFVLALTGGAALAGGGGGGEPVRGGEERPADTRVDETRRVEERRLGDEQRLGEDRRAEGERDADPDDERLLGRSGQAFRSTRMVRDLVVHDRSELGATLFGSLPEMKAVFEDSLDAAGQAGGRVQARQTNDRFGTERVLTFARLAGGEARRGHTRFSRTEVPGSGFVTYVVKTERTTAKDGKALGKREEISILFQTDAKGALLDASYEKRTYGKPYRDGQIPHEARVQLETGTLRDGAIVKESRKVKQQVLETRAREEARAKG